MEDIRWKQRFSNYQKALQRLKDNIEYFSTFLAENTPPADILKQGLIQSFEFTHELAWNVMKDYAVYQGNSEIKGSRDAVRYSAQVSLISDGFGWMEMIQSRNSSSHTYNEDTANEITEHITSKYFPLFIEFQEKMLTLMEE